MDTIQKIIKFHPIFLEKVWGGTKLKKLLDKQILNNNNIGESWELSAYNEKLSIIKEGPWKNKNFKELIKQYPKEIIGKTKKTIEKFPLLIKFIDAQEFLSVQVHPNNQARSKKEAWYILGCEEKSKIYCGFKQDTNQQDLKNLISEKKVETILKTYFPQKGDAFLINPGTIHAIGSGILLLEIQESSDSTYRVYDYGRDRELHLQQAFEVLNYQKADNSEKLKKNTQAWKFGNRNLLTRNDKFFIEHFQTEKASFTIPVLYKEPTFQILILLAGHLQLDKNTYLKKGELAFFTAEKMKDKFFIQNQKTSSEFIITGLGSDFADFK